MTEEHDHYKTLAMGHGIPEACADGLALYIAAKIAPGSFVTAVLENDLREACGRADSQNRHLLFNYMSFLYNDAPSNCWGSRQKVSEWLS